MSATLVEARMVAHNALATRTAAAYAQGVADRREGRPFAAASFAEHLRDDYLDGWLDAAGESEGVS